jgi:hypothetical protein
MVPDYRSGRLGSGSEPSESNAGNFQLIECSYYAQCQHHGSRHTGEDRPVGGNGKGFSIFSVVVGPRHAATSPRMRVMWASMRC